MRETLPQFIDPVLLAERNAVLSGHFPLSQCSRLASSLANSTGEVNVHLTFQKEGHLAVIHGQIDTQLQLLCQGCLEVMTLPLTVQVQLAVVKNLEQAERLAENYAPLLVADEKLLLHELIEDELLLAVPDFPRHATDCHAETTPSNAKTAAVPDKLPAKNNPFSILAQLKSAGDS